MPIFDLYLESGPRQRKTMVHVLDLAGCIAVGATTAEALAATPDAIRAFQRFLIRQGEPFDPDSPIETRIAEHITEGEFLGNGSPYILFGPDWAPLTSEDVELYLRRIGGTSRELGAWAAARTEEQLAETPAAGGRPAREMLRHVLAARGAFLASALGGAPGVGRIASAYEREELPVQAAFEVSTARFVTIIEAATPEQRAAVRQLPSGPKTLRQALRRLLEHDWEHLAELSRRPGGPML